MRVAGRRHRYCIQIHVGMRNGGANSSPIMYGMCDIRVYGTCEEGFPAWVFVSVTSEQSDYYPPPADAIKQYKEYPARESTRRASHLKRALKPHPPVV